MVLLSCETFCCGKYVLVGVLGSPYWMLPMYYRSCSQCVAVAGSLPPCNSLKITLFIDVHLPKFNSELNRSFFSQYNCLCGFFFFFKLKHEIQATVNGRHITCIVSSICHLMSQVSREKLDLYVTSALSKVFVVSNVSS